MNLVVRVVRHALELVPARVVHVCLHVLVAGELLDCEQVQVVQVLRIAHREQSRVESDVVAPVQVVNHVLVRGQHLFGQGKAQVGTMRALLVLWVHLHHNAGTVVGEVDGVFLVEADADDVAVPAYALVLVYAVEFRDGP